jgi:formate dehydrogenase subunit delta
VTPDRMIHLANQIALFFQPYPHEEAVTGVTSHLVQFWEARMLRQIKAYVAEDGAGLHQLVVEAVKRLPAAKGPI